MERKLINCEFIVFTIFIIFILSPCALFADSPWPMFHHDRQRTGLSEYAGPSSPVLAWSYQTTQPIESSPAIGSDGKVCFGSQDGYLYVVNSDASLAWSYRGGGDGFYNASPALGSDGKVYIGGVEDNNRLYSINSDASLAWSYETGHRIYCSSPTIDSDGKVYVGSDDNRLYSINSTAGLAWSYETDGDIESSPALGFDGKLYVG
jgi:outer membrane protein assembly factor BamB